MREQDGRTHADIIDLFRWSNADSFWRQNILSPSKLRQQWDKLTIQRNNHRNGKPAKILSDDAIIAKLKIQTRWSVVHLQRLRDQGKSLDDLSETQRGELISDYRQRHGGV
jgi:hypothetical protein